MMLAGNEMSEAKVTIWCITYNHVKYIRQTLEGFLMQKTSFHYEIFIHDDASTDGTTQILKEYEEKYPGLFVVFYEEKNRYYSGIDYQTEYLLPKMNGKYVAFCEGDDYWCSENKLQLQFDYMETHKECFLCTHDVEMISENGEGYLGTIPPQKTFLEDQIIASDQMARSYLCEGLYFHTSSYFLKAELLRCEIYKSWLSRLSGWTGDACILHSAMANGDIGYIHATMSKRRMDVPGSWTDRSSMLTLKEQYYAAWNLTNTEIAFDELTKYRWHDYVAQMVMKKNLDWLNLYDATIIMDNLKEIEDDYVVGGRLPLKWRVKYYTWKWFPKIAHTMWKMYLYCRVKKSKGKC